MAEVIVQIVDSEGGSQTTKVTTEHISHIVFEWVQNDNDLIPVEFNLDDSIGFTETMKVKTIPSCTPENPFYIKWVNQFAGWEYHMFSCGSTNTTKINTVSTYSPYLEKYEEIESFNTYVNERQYSVESVESTKVATLVENKNERNKILSILTSPNIQHWNENTRCWEHIHAPKQSINFVKRDGVYEVAIELVLPKPNLQF